MLEEASSPKSSMKGLTKDNPIAGFGDIEESPIEFESECLLKTKTDRYK